MSGALSGLVVADFTRVLAGPYATMLLGDMGAEVIKVERPESGDDTRHWVPPQDAAGRATYFEAVNRNKSSIEIDMTTEDGKREGAKLIEKADVVIHNFPQSNAIKLGLDYQTVSKINPEVIYCSISGFGSKAGAAIPGYDLLVQAMGGLMSITGANSEEPSKVGVALVDVITGLHATIGILAALNHRNETGQGQAVEVNLLSSILSGLVNQASGYVSGGVIPKSLGNAHPSISPYEVYPTADRPIVLAVGNESQFAKLCKVLDCSELPTDPKFNSNANRVSHRQELNQVLISKLSKQGADYWWKALTDAGVPSGPINNVAEAFDLAEKMELNPIVEIIHNGEVRKQVANPITFSKTPVEYRSAPPALGEKLTEKYTGKK
jgi:crotonobetainyl-CoA:carnitine CoA-transferase CaiB-like acyl-CoA transferase